MDQLQQVAKLLGVSAEDLAPYLDHIEYERHSSPETDFLEFMYWKLSWSDMPYEWNIRELYKSLGGKRN